MPERPYAPARSAEPGMDAAIHGVRESGAGRDTGDRAAEGKVHLGYS